MASRAFGLHYRGWLIQCTRERIAGGWCSLVEVWRPGRDLGATSDIVPFTTVFDEADDAYVEGLEAGKRWIDARQ